MRQLKRNYIFEFAGMPQSGKSMVREILAHYFKRMEYPLVEFNGGSRYSRFPVNRMHIGELNEKLAHYIEDFVRSIEETNTSNANIYLLDRGLIDRCIFTEALVRVHKVDPDLAEKLYMNLTAPELLERLDGVFMFVTSPATALEREYAHKLIERKDVRSQGDVMNENFLREMYMAAKLWRSQMSGPKNAYVNVEWIDTTPLNTDMQKIARDVFDSINNWYPELKLQLASTK